MNSGDWQMIWPITFSIVYILEAQQANQHLRFTDRLIKLACSKLHR